MPTTEHIHLPLYTDEETPDLSTTGHYNHAVEILDANFGDIEAKSYMLAEAIDAESNARIAGDTSLNADIEVETRARTIADTALDTAYKAADTALGGRIDNAEAEISANSADLTGIKGLTYGEQQVNFVKNRNGKYTSPALEEIAEQIMQGMTCIQIPATSTDVSSDTILKLQSDWPNVALMETTNTSSSIGYNILFPVVASELSFAFIPIAGTYSDNGAPYNHYVEISTTGNITRQDMSLNPYWTNITNKPFSAIGTGLKVVSDALTVDTAALPANTTFGDLTSGVSA